MSCHKCKFILQLKLKKIKYIKTQQDVSAELPNQVTSVYILTSITELMLLHTTHFNLLDENLCSFYYAIRGKEMQRI